jgi:hypothetical protein
MARRLIHHDETMYIYHIYTIHTTRSSPLKSAVTSLSLYYFLCQMAFLHATVDELYMTTDQCSIIPNASFFSPISVVRRKSRSYPK